MTKTKEVDGVILAVTNMLPQQARITVRFTSDKKGRTLSLSYDNEIMLAVAFEDIKDLVESKDEN